MHAPKFVRGEPAQPLASLGLVVGQQEGLHVLVKLGRVPPF
ncbi:hypothetical protein [Hymenobacter terrenus]|nr:hypothetical protein [Hymenobacter terrenus]